jgi:hypothetical protein
LIQKYDELVSSPLEIKIKFVWNLKKTTKSDSVYTLSGTRAKMKVLEGESIKIHDGTWEDILRYTWRYCCRIFVDILGGTVVGYS